MSLIYIGKSAVPGIPARDLTDEEVKRYGGKTKLLSMGLWQEYRATKSKKQTAEKDGE